MLQKYDKKSHKS